MMETALGEGKWCVSQAATVTCTTNLRRKEGKRSWLRAQFLNKMFLLNCVDGIKHVIAHAKALLHHPRAGTQHN